MLRMGLVESRKRKQAHKVYGVLRTEKRKTSAAREWLEYAWFVGCYVLDTRHFYRRGGL